MKARAPLRCNVPSTRKQQQLRPATVFTAYHACFLFAASANPTFKDLFNTNMAATPITISRVIEDDTIVKETIESTGGYRNNLSYALMLKKARDEVMLPQMDAIIKHLAGLAKERPPQVPCTRPALPACRRVRGGVGRYVCKAAYCVISEIRSRPLAWTASGRAREHSYDV